MDQFFIFFHSECGERFSLRCENLRLQQNTREGCWNDHRQRKGNNQLRRVHISTLVLCVLVLSRTLCGGQPATTPSTRPSVQSGGAQNGAPEVSVYVPAVEWDLKAREDFPIVVDLSLPEHLPQEGQSATFETYERYNKQWREYAAAADNPRAKDSYLRLTFELKDSDGVQQSLLINGELIGKRFRIAGGSTFEKTVLGRVMVQGNVTMTLRAYCYISGVLIGTSEPLTIKLTNSLENYMEESPR